MRILSIGNSFSQDAQRWLHTLAEQNGLDYQTTNLYIGGCTLERHWNNVLNQAEEYLLERNGVSTQEYVSIQKMLEQESWDIITVQQASGWSGFRETYEPYLSSLAALVREKQPQAKLYFHQTWAYEKDFTAERYGRYDFNQEKMFRCIQDASGWAADTIQVDMIPTGEIIQKIRRELPEFRYEDGGLSLCRDGFHLSLDYGRYTAAAVWIAAFSGKKLKALPFEDFDADLLEKIVDMINTYFERA